MTFGLRDNKSWNTGFISVFNCKNGTCQNLFSFLDRWKQKIGCQNIYSKILYFTKNKKKILLFGQDGKSEFKNI